MPAPEIETLESREIHRTRWIGIREDTVRYRDGSVLPYTVVEKSDFAAILAIDDRGQLYLVEQYRYAIGRRSLELPMGSSDALLAPVDIARCELQEETGITANDISQIGTLTISGGYMAQRCLVFLATGLTLGAASPELQEQGMTVQPKSIAEVEAMIANGMIDNVATVAAFGLAKIRKVI